MKFLVNLNKSVLIIYLLFSNSFDHIFDFSAFRSEDPLEVLSDLHGDHAEKARCKDVHSSKQARYKLLMLKLEICYFIVKELPNNDHF